MENEKYIDVCREYNLPMDTNAIGASGENIAKAILEFLPFFRVVFMGEKNPITDFYLELTNKEKPYPFLVQVKTTSSELDSKGRLCVSVPKDKYKALCKRPLPTYVAGVHLDNQSLFLSPAFDVDLHINTIPPNMVIDMKNITDCADKLRKIEIDVMSFWDGLSVENYKITFNSSIK